MQAHCSICLATVEDSELCAACANLLRWVRGYFADEPGLPAKITPETRFVEDLGVESLDWMCWPLEAEEKLGVTFPDRELERIQTVGQFIRALREAGAVWPDGFDVRLAPRPRWWSSYRWDVVESAGDAACGDGAR